MQETSTSQNTVTLIARSIIVAAIIIGGAIALPKLGNPEARLEAQMQQEEQSQSLLLYEVSDDDHQRGAKNPKVTIVEFSDFGCHFCGVLHPTLINLVEKYPNDIQWVYRQLPFRNVPGAYASECVARLAGEEAFWQFTDTVFATQESHTPELFRRLAGELDVDMDTYDECLESQDIIDAVAQDQLEATILDVRATPYSVVITSEGREFPVRGAVPAETWEQLLTPFLE